jgi:cysteine desulfuration protein SufE
LPSYGTTRPSVTVIVMSATTPDSPVSTALPPALQEVIDGFQEAPRSLVLELLLEYADAVPPLPAHLADHPELLERVPECQTPFFLRAEFDADDRLALWFQSPPEAPTTRAFAGILTAGLNGAAADDVLAVPDDFYLAMGLGEVISPLRLRGMSAILGRLKRQVREHRS